tara:strand:- start:8977 stop:10713 length:1737 start_codon:yes stop_codon:yes gene_type:complete
VLQALSKAVNPEGGEKKFLILRAPTGTGKSAIAATLAQHVRAQGGNVHMLASHKYLQKQYLEDFGSIGMKILWGKANYDCTQALKLNKLNSDGSLINCHQCLANRAPSRPEYIKRYCTDTRYFGDLCPYIVAKEEAKQSTLTVCNYASFLAHAHYAETFSRRNLLIVDEAHLLAARLADFASTKFLLDQIGPDALCGTPQEGPAVTYLSWLEGPLREDLEDQLVHWSQELNSNVQNVATAITAANALMQKDALLASITDTAQRRSDPPQHRIVKLTKLLDKLVRLCEMIKNNPKNWVVYNLRDAKERLIAVEFKPVVIGPLAKRYLFDYGDTVLLMSATLDNSQFLYDLGIQAPEVATFLDVPSVFDIKTRPLITMFCGSMSYKHRDATLPKVVSTIADLLVNKHPQGKGVVHAHSFKNVRDIKRLLPKHLLGRFIWHTSSNRKIEDVTAEFYAATDKWLISPSCTEGLDGKYDRVRAQILIKAPYPTLKDPQVAARKELPNGQLWYALCAANKIIQAYGRGTRSKDDYCVTYVLDSAVARLIQSTRNYIPAWFVDAWNRAHSANWEWDGSKWNLRAQ